ncbi:hypothetical protein DENSPDRAFT_660602 [Dentipellis sp. KUC8613]|nr:hypothetical protein DENSPDRAFT_660602 [Dentipellis sp. KUC8613]
MCVLLYRLCHRLRPHHHHPNRIHPVMKSWKSYESMSALAFTTLSIISIVFSYSLSLVARDIKFVMAHPSTDIGSSNHYTYEGSDYPNTLPVNLDHPVQTVMEESVHYGLDDDAARDEWEYTSPFGAAFIRLGPDARMFYPDMFHPMHCLRYVHGVLVEVEESNVNHLEHCLNYLRRITLCHIDLTLEPGDFVTRNFTSDAVGQTHICRDWKTVYDAMEADWVSWLRYRSERDMIDVSPQ